MSFPINVSKSVNPIYSGDAWLFTCVFTRPDALLPIDLPEEGWSNWRAQWRPYAKSSTYIDLIVDETQAANGRITLSMSQEDTASIDTNGVFDLEAVQEGLIRTWVRGDVLFKKDVTR